MDITVIAFDGLTFVLAGGVLLLVGWEEDQPTQQQGRQQGIQVWGIGFKALYTYVAVARNRPAKAMMCSGSNVNPTKAPPR